MRIPYTTIQKVRRFLTALGVAPSVYADSTEVLSLLTESVRRRRGDPAVRASFFDLLELLQDRTDADPADLPAPVDESIDASALARELELIWTERPVAGSFTHRRALAAVLVLAMLLVGTALNLACDSDDDDANGLVCAADTTTEHFAALIEPADELTTAQKQEAVDDYNELSTGGQKDLIADLCGMSADEIAAYLEGEFGSLGDDDDDNDNDNNNDDNNNNNDNNNDDDNDNQGTDDDDAVYKGVSF